MSENVTAPIVSSDARRTTLSMLTTFGAFESMPDGSWAFVSAGFSDLLGGLPTSELLGRGWIRRIHPDDVQGTLASYRQARDLRRSWDHRFRMLRADGTPIWLAIRASPLPQSPRAEGVAYLGLAADISARIREQEVARETSRLLDDMNDLITEGLVLTRGGRIIAANRAAASIAGFTMPQALVGMHVDELLSMDASPRYEALSRGTASESGTGRVRRRDTGEQVLVAINIKDVIYAGGEARMTSFLPVDDPHIRAALADRNERRLATLESLLPFAYHRIRLDMDHVGEIEYANQHLCDLLGMTPEQILGLRAKDLIHPDDREVSKASMAMFARGEGRLAPFVLRMRRGDGTYIRLRNTAALYRDPVSGMAMCMVLSEPVEE